MRKSHVIIAALLSLTMALQPVTTMADASTVEKMETKEAALEAASKLGYSDLRGKEYFEDITLAPIMPVWTPQMVGTSYVPFEKGLLGYKYYDFDGDGTNELLLSTVEKDLLPKIENDPGERGVADCYDFRLYMLEAENDAWVKKAQIAYPCSQIWPDGTIDWMYRVDSNRVTILFQNHGLAVAKVKPTRGVIASFFYDGSKFQQLEAGISPSTYLYVVDLEERQKFTEKWQNLGLPMNGNNLVLEKAFTDEYSDTYHRISRIESKVNRKLTGPEKEDKTEKDAITVTVKQEGDAPAATPTTTTEASSGNESMYRMYNPNSSEHFYTSSMKERNKLMEVGWNYEGVGWLAPKKSNTPVYRLYNKAAGDHHYTTSKKERKKLEDLGWIYEKIGWYSDDNHEVPLYRQYNPNASTGTHNYTTSKKENNKLVSIGWRAEGIGWYGAKGTAQDDGFTDTTQDGWYFSNLYGKTHHMFPYALDEQLSGKKFYFHGTFDYAESLSGKRKRSDEAYYEFQVSPDATFVLAGGDGPERTLSNSEFASRLRGKTHIGQGMTIEVSGEKIVKITISA